MRTLNLVAMLCVMLVVCGCKPSTPAEGGTTSGAQAAEAPTKHKVRGALKLVDYVDLKTAAAPGDRIPWQEALATARKQLKSASTAADYNEIVPRNTYNEEYDVYVITFPPKDLKLEDVNRWPKGFVVAVDAQTGDVAAAGPFAR